MGIFSAIKQRAANKALAKANSEVMFFVNPFEAVRMGESPLPVLGLMKDLTHTVSNTVDTFKDLTAEEIFGQKRDKRDKTPAFYYSSRWIPGVSQLRKVLELFEQDKRTFYDGTSM